MKYKYGPNIIPVEMARDYVAKHEVYEKIEEDGKIVLKRIYPSMIKVVMIDGKETEAYMTRVCNNHIYRELKHEIDNENKRQERRGKCSISNNKGKTIRCGKSCKDCCLNKKASVISLEGYTENHYKDDSPSDLSLYTDSPEEIVINEEIKQIIYDYIAELPEIDRKIVEMFMEEHKEREIAYVLGMTQANVNIRKKKIFKEFKIFLQHYL